MKFVKMHGAGNDYVYIDCFKEYVENPEELARYVSDRHKGIGSDGLVLILPSEEYDFKMRMYNADGSEAQMCGNASRCVGKYVYDYGLTSKTKLSLETRAGVKYLDLFIEEGKVERVRVDMGEPILKPSRIPVNLPLESVVNYEADFSFDKYSITCVSMGNPHAVIFTHNINQIRIEDVGTKIENHPLFPERVNVEFAEIITPHHVRMRVWERGSGETQACGTGACATLVAGVLTESLDRKAFVSLLGGDLEIEWNADNNHVYMTGDAVTVFEGNLNIQSNFSLNY